MTDEHADAADTVWGTTAFVPGGGVGLVSRHTVGIVARDHPSTRERLWELAAADAALDDILDDLSSTGLKALPDFGLAQVEGRSIRVVARGAVTITATRANGDDRVIDPAGVRTWIEEAIDDVTSIDIVLTGDDGDVASGSDTYAVLAGSVPARSLTRRFDTADSHASTALADGWSADPASSGDAAAAVVTPDDESTSIPEVDVQMPADVEEPDGLDTDAPPEVAPSAEWFDEGAGDEAVSASIPPQPSSEPEGGAEPDPGVEPSPPAEPEPVPSDRPAPDTPPSAVQPGPPVVPSGPPSGPGTGGPPPGPAVSPSPVPSDAAPPSGPDVAASSVPSGPPPPGAVPGAPPDATVVEPDPPVPNTPSSVSSLFDDAVADTTAVASSDFDRPTHAVLVFSNGDRVEVDRPVLIGRNPKVSGGVDGVLPHIMKFDGPGQGLSRTHAEVRVDDGVLVVEDLDSTNGTEVELPGHPRTRLVGGEPLAIGPGALVDFGDELHCTVESAS